MLDGSPHKGKTAHTDPKTYMNDPIDNLRKAFDEAQTMAELREFARRSEESLLEEEWKAFVKKAVCPAFDRVKREVFRDKLEELVERPADPGFKVQDLSGTEFWFWIELRGRLPEPKARRKYGKSPGVLVVATQSMSSKPKFELKDVTEGDIVHVIAQAYKKSLPKR